MKKNITKKICCLLTALALTLTTVLVSGTIEAKADTNDTTVLYESQSWETVTADTEFKYSFTVTDNERIYADVYAAVPASVTVTLYNSTGEAASTASFSESDYIQKETDDGTPYYALVLTNGKWQPGDYAFGLTFASDNLISAYVAQDAIPASISQTSATITQGFTQKLSVSGGTVKSWSSSKKAVATVDKNGKVTAKKAGKTTITATLTNGQKLKCTVTVAANKYSYTKYTTADCPWGEVVFSVYSAQYDKSGNLVLKASCVNQSYQKITGFSNVKIKVKDANGKAIGTYSAKKVKASQTNGSAKTYTFTIKKSALKQKNADLRNAQHIDIDGKYNYTLYY